MIYVCKGSRIEPVQTKDKLIYHDNVLAPDFEQIRMEAQMDISDLEDQYAKISDSRRPKSKISGHDLEEEMDFGELENQYTEILESSRRRGEILGSTGASDKRRHPRMVVETGELFISTVPEFSVLDMSLSGMAFLSNHPLEEGEMIHIALGDMISVDAQILTCRLEEAPTEFLDAQFRINCEFVHDSRAMELLVTLKGKPN